MLLHLDLKDFVLVDRTSLDFSSGFSALTGETGAGKSILLDALGFLLGGKADASMVRQGADKADINASLAVSAPVQLWLSEHDFDASSELQLRRTLDSSGKNRCYINGTPCTATQMRELGEQLIDIHGQHDQQRLLKPSSQRALLDDYAQHPALLEAVKTSWGALQAASAALNTAQTQQSELDAQRDQLSWAQDELTHAKPLAGEWEALETEHKKLSHSAQLLSTLQGVLTGLDEGDEPLAEQARQMHHSVHSLSKLDEAAGALAEPIETAYIHLQEAARGIAHYLKNADLDPERLAHVEQRIALLYATARKLRLAPAELPQRLIEIAAELQALNAAQDIAALARTAAQAQAAFDAAASALSASRQTVASKLSAAVTQSMQALALGGGQFSIDCQPAAPSQNGVDAVDFLVTANVGQSLRPLAKVASGGELARMSLALCVVTAAQSAVPCLIFDEVDSGIGGATADIVGQQLRQLGTQVQVLAVTHLAQVAANAHQQFKVSKYVANDQSISKVEPLDDAARVDEIARMLGGENITVTTRYHAQELLATALHKRAF